MFHLEVEDDRPDEPKDHGGSAINNVSSVDVDKLDLRKINASVAICNAGHVGGQQGLSLTLLLLRNSRAVLQLER